MSPGEVALKETRTPVTRSALPIDEVLPELLSALRESPGVVLQAPTGAGKTTRVPPALLDSGLAGSGQIIMLEPRRIAARAAAARMAFERGSSLGEEIGYQVRFDRRSGPKTRILVVTEGILLRMLQDDPFLESVGAVLFDEFHERSLQSDLALAMVHRVQETVRPELKLVVMSATLAALPIAAYLGNCPVIESAGRLHPVEIEYLPAAVQTNPLDAVASSVERILSRTAGDVLVFLPGLREIRHLRKRLATLADREGLLLLELYGDLPPEKQDAVLGPSRQRKVVLATNVAETSLTIDGVTGVVDTGLARILKTDRATGLDRLVLSRISKASANQRAGRAGRTAPGVCLRLWTEREHHARPEHEEPEIRRVDIAGPVLELLCWGESDIAAFPWFEPPRPEAIEHALQLLRRLGAIEEGQVTDLGRSMVRIPAHPRIARLLVEGQRLGHPDIVGMAAALLSERDPFLREEGEGRGARRPRHHAMSDVLERVAALSDYEKSGRRETSCGPVHVSAARQLLHARDQFTRLVRQTGRESASKPASAEEALLRGLLVAYPDRLAWRREPGSRRGVMVGGRGVRLAEESVVAEPELFVCVDIDAGKGESLVRMASGVRREWLPRELVVTRTEVEFDVEQDRVLAFRRIRFEDLILDEAITSATDEEEVARALAAAASERLDRALPLNEPEVKNFLARVRCLREWIPELELPAFDEEDLRELLPALCRGRRSFADLRRAPLLDHLRGTLSYPQQQALDQHAPERIAVPSGSRIALQYEEGRPPVLAVRIQELFGLAETPRIARGRVPVLLHLLAPNMRPQQVTDDLRSFWNNTYAQVRKDLRRRYPKHAWPEDPWNAPPERRPGRKS